MSVKSGYLSNLTPLRGIAAILVAVFHFEMAIGRFVPAATTMFFEKSYLMVDLFFVLSGFIMLHVYSRAFDGALPSGQLRHFFVARFARTYPLHLFTLLLLVVIVRYLTNWGNPPIIMEQPRDILPNVFLLQSFGVCKIFNWNIPSWSISAEWGAYLLFPFLALWISRQRKWAPVLLAVGVVAAWCCIEYALPRTNPINPAIPVPHNLNTTFDYGWLRGMAGFTAGMVVYRLYCSPGAGRVIGSDPASVLILLLVVAGLHFAINDALVAALFAALVLNFALNSGVLHRICNNRVLQYLGDISYSIYLMQIFPQEPFSHGARLPGVTGNARGRFNIDFWPGLGYCVIYLVLLVGIASVTYYVIERPCRKWINERWGRAEPQKVIPLTQN
ncbi:MAG TPA: acyltransferase [Puia sp.]|jgi:peptidoglycan/LPS O-acetylase OafA/YrhL|nr:acyltransferase [Puia sp.]